MAEDGHGALFALGPGPTLFVRVEDKALESDGAPKRPWLPVPPHAASAREAVAWTFGRPAAAYAPELETCGEWRGGRRGRRWRCGGRSRRWPTAFGAEILDEVDTGGAVAPRVGGRIKVFRPNTPF